MAKRQAARRALIVIDKYGWSYDAIAQGLVRRLDREDLAIEILSEKEDRDEIERRRQEFDLVFVMGWTQLFEKKKKAGLPAKMPFLDPRRTVTGVHSHRAWDDYRSLPDFTPPPPEALIERLSSLRAVNIISRRLFRLFQDAGLENAVLTENGVDTALFRPECPVGGDRGRPLVVGFSGSAGIAKHDYLKGYSEFIAPLSELPNVEVRVLGGRGQNQVPRSAMPKLYNQIDLYLCASTSEGFSQSVLEAASCGRGVVSTRVGGCEDLIEEGVNGWFVSRDMDAIRERILALEADRAQVAALGAANRRIVEQRYCWSLQSKLWLDFIEANLPERSDREAAA